MVSICRYAALLLTLIVVLSGCVPINGTVSVYYSNSLNLQGESYAFYPIKKIKQNTDPQYDYFSSLISSTLSKSGLKQVSQLSKAKYAIVFLYWVGQGMQQFGTAPVYGQTGTQVVGSNTFGNAYSTGMFGGFNNFSANTTSYSHTSYDTKPTYGVVGERAYTYIEYPYYLCIYIFRQEDVKFLGNIKPVYLASVTTTQNESSPEKIFPAMIELWGSIFPGISGKTY